MWRRATCGPTSYSPTCSRRCWSAWSCILGRKLGAGTPWQDWADDVAAAADQLEIEKVAVLGVSGGGKYAAACSYAMPDRVTRVAIVSGVGPPATPLLREGLGRELEKELSEPDNAVAEDPQIREWALVTFREALRGGAAGVVQDAAIQARAWGFGPEQIQTPVQLRHGDRDEIVPLHHAS